MTLPFSLRVALRELRGGLRGFRVFLACVALGVAAIAIVGSVKTAIHNGLSSEATSLLGGDVELEFTYRTASGDELAWMSQIADGISEIVDFRSMVSIQQGETRERALAQVKGVDDAYPLYGQVVLDPEMPLAEALETRKGMPGMVAEPVLLERLGLQVGAILRLGTQDFELRAALTREPDSAAAGFGLGPRVIVDSGALDGSGLLTPGTLYESRYRLRLPPGADLTALERAAKQDLRDNGIRWRDRRNGTPGLTRFVDRMGAFLVLVGLAGLAVGGVGISAAVRAYLEGKTETIATLKTLGATGNTIFAIYLLQTGLMTLIGIALGLLLGAAVPVVLGPFLADQLPVPAVFDIYGAPLLEAAYYGFLTALIFTVWPLARARDIRAAGLFRDIAAPERGFPRPVYLALLLVLVTLLIGGAAILSGIPELALWSAFGILAALGVLVLAAQAARRIAARLAHSRLVLGRPSLRLALGSVGGPGGETGSVVLSLGLGLSVLAAVGQIDSNMQSAIVEDLPAEAPAYFVVDIQKDQLAGFSAIATEDEGVSRIETAPMLRGIITMINGRPAHEVAGEHWATHGDRGITYAARPPAGTDIVEGTWWPADYTGPPQMSLAAEEAAEIGVGLGDQVTVNVLGRDLTATITSLRVVEFRNMGINFLMILNPSALEGAPHTNIATLYTTPEAEGRLLRTLADTYPNITAIRVRDAINRVAEALRGLAAATRYGAAATLLTGFVVLIGAAAAGERRRVFEAAVLKTLGAARRTILLSFALRSALLGATAGAVAIVAGGLAGWSVMHFVMEAEFTFEPYSAITIVLGGAMASLLAGIFFSLRPLNTRPARVLRARD